MATSLKTVEYWFPHLAAAADAADQNFTQITVDLPESSKTFKNVTFDVTYHDANTTLTGTSTRRQLSISVNGAGYTAVNNTNTYTLSGENFVATCSGDFTSHFTTNYSGTSHTVDARFLYDMSTATPVGARNISGRLRITYEYDDTTTTQVKTVWLPLNAPVGALATSKPGSAVATIPALDTELPEASKTILQTVVVVQGNTHTTAATDNTYSYEIDTNGVFTTGSYEQGGTQAMWFRYNDVASFTTNATHGFRLWSSLASGNHLQAYLVVTYTFNASTSTSSFNSLILPMELDSPMGGTTSSDYQRGTRTFYIEEPTTITTKQIAFFPYWDQITAMAGLNMRVGTGSFVTYTDTAAIMAGSNGAMVRNDSAFTFARGENTLQFDVYRTDTTDLGWNISGFWIINYTSGVASGGFGTHSRTVFWSLLPFGTAATSANVTISATAPVIPESNYFLIAAGAGLEWLTNSTGTMTSVTVLVERLSSGGEGGVQWETVYRDATHTDPETGVRFAFAQMRTLFKRWPNDPGADRMDFETSRRWRIFSGQNISSFWSLDLIFSYHSITFTVGGTVSGSGGGTVNLALHRAASGEKVLSTSRSGNGAYSFTWYDSATDTYVVAHEDSTHMGRSDDGVAT